MPSGFLKRLLLTPVCALSLSLQASLPEVKPVDLSELDPAQFTDEELFLHWFSGPNQVLPFYLHHFHRLANSMVETGPNRGFLELEVWRRRQDVRPHNIRIMENLTSLAWFYATDRPWNPYFRDPATRARLEAGLEFWISQQNTDGRFSEYAPQRWNLAGTAFATKFMAETLELLKDGPPIDSRLKERVWQTQLNAILAVLERPDFFNHGRRFSNQFGNVWGAALMYLQNRPDRRLESALRQRLGQLQFEFQSPAGFYYEADGVDWGYAFGTHKSNLMHALHYARGTQWESYFVKEIAAWAEWFAYNSYPEPNEDIFLLNAAIQSRQSTSLMIRLETPFHPQVPILRVWHPTTTEIAERKAVLRESTTARWPEVNPLRVGDFFAYSPYAFLHRRSEVAGLTEADRREAIRQLPYRQRDSFFHQRMDSRNPYVFSFVQRPGYYAIFNSGPHLRDRLRFGLGLLAHPATGTFLHGREGDDRMFWGTRGSAPKAYEAGDLFPRFLSRDGRREHQPSPGNRDLPGEFQRIEYELGTSGRKALDLHPEALRVAVEYAGSFVEQLPLLLPPDSIQQTDRGLLAEFADHRIEFIFLGADRIEIHPAQSGPAGTHRILSALPREGLNDSGFLLQGKRPVLVEVHATDRLDYQIQVIPH